MKKGLLLIPVFAIVLACKKDNKQPEVVYTEPEIEIDSVINNSNTSVRVYVSILSTGGGENLETLGANYDVSGQNNNIYINTDNLSKTVGSGFFDINNLQPSTNYVVDFWVNNLGNKQTTVSKSFSTLPPVLGQTIGAGKCAYILQPGDNGYDPATTHGFIISWNNGSQAIASSVTNWGCSGTIVGSNQTALGSGGQNSSLIWGCAMNPGTAVRYCYEYNGNNPFATQSVWVLPSTEELLKIYLNRSQIGLNIGASSTMNYWSSTESSATKAMVVNLSLGSQYPDNKVNPVNQTNVLAIRYF